MKHQTTRYLLALSFAVWLGLPASAQQQTPGLEIAKPPVPPSMVEEAAEPADAAEEDAFVEPGKQMGEANMNDDSGDAGSHGEDSVAEEAEQAERELNVASNPQEEAINNVVFAGLMSGYPDGRFHPEGTLTRAQLASIVNKTFNLKQRKLPQNGQTNPEAQMTDVPARYWAAADIRQVLRHNIMEGYREGVFHPNQPVSRAEALAIFAQAYGVYQYDDPTVVSILSHYPDAEGLPGWSRKAMATALQHGFVNAQQGEPIHPMQPMTRGDMAYTLNEYLNRLHPSEKPTGATTGNPTKK